jgi:hypothetical protein
MPFKNRIRLPFYLTRPQFPTESNVFRLADGTRKTLSVAVLKTFEGETENLPKEIHERLVIALKHDDVTVEGRYLATGVSMEGDYEIDWLKFLDYPLAKAAFKVQVTPYNYSNDNCQTCEEMSQVVCEDDDLGTLNENTDYNVGVIDNDSICCSPFTQTIVSYNTDFIDAIVTNFDFRITLHIKYNVPSANSVVLARYRITCQNGSYDEANLIANIVGTNPTPVCLAPTSPVLISLNSDTSATFSWTEPSPLPACGYYWEIKNSVNVVISSGTSATDSIVVTGLPSNESFLRFYVRSNCCSLDSNFAGPVIFSLPPPSGTETCGMYELSNTDPADFHIGNYVDCNGDQQFVNIGPLHQRIICALQSSPGNPVDISVDFEISINYLGLC